LEKYCLKVIFTENLLSHAYYILIIRISVLTFFRELDLMIIILNNRTILSRRLSHFTFLSNAGDEILNKYELQLGRIYWKDLDADLGLRGLLIEEIMNTITSSPKFAA